MYYPGLKQPGGISWLSITVYAGGSGFSIQQEATAFPDLSTGDDKKQGEVRITQEMVARIFQQTLVCCWGQL